MLVLVGDLLTHFCNDVLELGGPHAVQFVHFLVSLDAILSQRLDEILRCFGVLFSLNTLRFGRGLSVLLALIGTGSCLLNRGEKVRSGENLVEILELLACLDFVRFLDRLLINFINMGESVHYECP